jgi:hypothetical protein
MNIRFKQNIVLALATGFKGEYPIFEDESFKLGEVEDVEILDFPDNGIVANVQFGDSSVADVPLSMIEFLGEWVERSSGFYLVDSSGVAFGPVSEIPKNVNLA